jgi:ABC-type Fe3+ transport system permease subunit
MSNLMGARQETPWPLWFKPSKPLLTTVLLRGSPLKALGNSVGISERAGCFCFVFSFGLLLLVARARSRVAHFTDPQQQAYILFVLCWTISGGSILWALKVQDLPDTQDFFRSALDLFSSERMLLHLPLKT